MTGTEQKTPLGGSEAGGSDGLYAVLPLRDIVVFPHMIVPLFVGREKSIRALEEVMGVDKQILLATQKTLPMTIRHRTRFMKSARLPTYCSS